MGHQSEVSQSTSYPVTLDVRYKIFKHGLVVAAGSGHTVWIGSHQLVFTGDVGAGNGTAIEVSILWPAVLDGHVKLQLVIQGQVAAKDRNRITVHIEKYQFRTRAPALPPKLTSVRKAAASTERVQPVLLRAHASARG